MRRFRLGLDSGRQTVWNVRLGRVMPRSGQLAGQLANRSRRARTHQAELSRDIPRLDWPHPKAWAKPVPSHSLGNPICAWRPLSSPMGETGIINSSSSSRRKTHGRSGLSFGEQHGAARAERVDVGRRRRFSGQYSIRQGGRFAGQRIRVWATVCAGSNAGRRT